jgi:N-methylhydantoinase A/oxoprolinase/acetone carboxylase beta subunit
MKRPKGEPPRNTAASVKARLMGVLSATLAQVADRMADRTAFARDGGGR